jgi:hypothetical protein
MFFWSAGGNRLKRSSNMVYPNEGRIGPGNADSGSDRLGPSPLDSRSFKSCLAKVGQLHPSREQFSRSAHWRILRESRIPPGYIGVYE